MIPKPRGEERERMKLSINETTRGFGLVTWGYRGANKTTPILKWEDRWNQPEQVCDTRNFQTSNM